jgi:RNA polymerase sigma-70 factor (ECF subfamily)
MFSDEEFNAIAETYMDSIFRLALNYTKNYAEAEDITQNVLIKLYRAKTKFENKDHLRYWLFRVAVNECKRTLLSPWRRNESIELLENAFTFDETESREVFEAVMALPKKYRVPIYLYYYEDYSTEEIAKLLNIPGATIRTQLRRGREQLRDSLGGDENV